MSSQPEPHIVYRYVSHLVKDTFALVLAGGRGSTDCTN
jgi:glucose-1-phosphate adenylyltransferase